MTVTLFYLFSFVLISSALVVVSARNMVYGVMFLVLAFFNAAALFILVGAEFLAMLLIVVYVGAIAVLFLFVVMMLNVDNQVVQELSRKKPVLISICAVILTEIIMVVQFSSSSFHKVKKLYPISEDVNNVTAIGNVLYTDFILPFQLGGAVLFVAMIGAIVLTLKDETRFIKKQKIYDQISKNPKDCVEIVKVKSGEGVNI